MTRHESTSTRVMTEVGEQYRDAGLAERDALVGGLPRLGSQGSRLIDCAVLAVVVAVALLLIGEATGWNHPGTDLLVGLLAGGVWWFAGPALRHRS